MKKREREREMKEKMMKMLSSKIKRVEGIPCIMYNVWIKSSTAKQYVSCE